jgi:2-hydroxychromene-2-carboxylate isomerase
MDPDNPMKPRCTATNRQGKRCGKPPILGGTVCRMHGGAAPQVKAKALERLQAYQHRAIDRLIELANQTAFPSTAYAAVRDVLDRTMGKPTEQVAHEHTGTLTIKHELVD